MKGDVTLKKIIKIIVIASILIGCLYFGGNIYSAWNDKNVIDRETNELKKNIVSNTENTELPDEIEYSVDWTTLKQQCPNIVGWIYIPELNIDYPVVKASDNDFYLCHTATNVYDQYGAIFMDYECDSNFDSNNTIIHGHSITEIGGMFTNLQRFTDKNVFDSIKYYYLLTPNKNYKCNILAFSLTDSSSIYYNIDLERIVKYDWSDDLGRQVAKDIKKEKNYFFREFLNGATYTNEINLDSATKFVTLSTCNVVHGLYSGERYVLMSVLEEV